MTDLSSDAAALARSMDAVTVIRQVVHAVWALSRAQLPLVEEAATAASIYQDWVDRVVVRVAGEPAGGGEQDAARTLTVLFGPERAYSSALARRMAEEAPSTGELGLVGATLAETVRALPEVDARVRFRVAGSVAHDDLHEVAIAVAEKILVHGRGATVTVVHPPPPSGGETRRVPLITARAPAAAPPETFSPEARVLEVAVVEAMAGRLAVGAVLALHAELRARIAAADAARHACEDRLAELESAWHLRRRETITRELLEIVAGREAAFGDLE